jgi:hypothetical protein
MKSPLPSNIHADYADKKKSSGSSGKDEFSAIENLEIKGHIFREFTIHIF